jgi:hypothetical protein
MACLPSSLTLLVWLEEEPVEHGRSTIVALPAERLGFFRRVSSRFDGVTGWGRYTKRCIYNQLQSQRPHYS